LGLAIGPVKAIAILAGLCFLAGVLRSIWVAFAAVVAVACLLPFATVPSGGAALTPTLLQLALLVLLGAYAVVLIIDRRQRVLVGPTQLAWLVLLGWLVFAFLLGLGRGYTPQTLHDFVKFLLALAVFPLTIQLVRTRRTAELVVAGLMAGITAAAAIGLALYAAGPAFTLNALSRLVPYGYPSGRIVRYIEDDPTRPMRAVGTGVDPNAFGGLLMVGLVLLVGQLLSRSPFVSRWLGLPAALLVATALLLTYSRGAWVGALAGILVILWLRRRVLLLPLSGLGLTVLLLGLGSGFVQRLWLGFTLQDPATKLRLREYGNAWAIIRRHPWFGVGFGDAPSVDLQTGVSSIYLTIATAAGLVGLVLFLATMGLVLAVAWRSWSRESGNRGEGLMVDVGAVLVAVLIVGLVDHYFFNIRFVHMAVLLWLLAGLLVALSAFATPAALEKDPRR
jgi:O-antigen ligase